MKHPMLRAPLAAALTAAALTAAAVFGVGSASAKEPVSFAVYGVEDAKSADDQASCRLFGPRHFERMQRYQRCVRKARRLQLVEKASLQQAKNL